MANTEDKVMAWVETELGKDPEIKSGDLFEKAKKAFASVGDLTVRQFHARYPLQVKRRAKSGGSSKKSSTRKRSSRKAAGSRAGTSTPKKSPSRKSSKKSPSKTSRKTGSRGRTATPEPRNTREAVRGVLMRFATELASAEAKAEVVKVLAGADRYVDEVLDVAGS